MATIEVDEELLKPRSFAAEQYDREGAAMEKVNAAARAVALPVPGTANATPQTDAANMSIYNAMERADLGGRFGFGSQQYRQGTEDIVEEVAPETDFRAIRNQRREAILKNIDPDAPARYIDKKRNLVLQKELHQLNQDEIRETALEAKLAHQTFKQNEDLRVMRDTNSAITKLAQIKAPFGSEEYEQEVILVRDQHPGAIESTAGRQAFGRVAKIQDTERTYKRTRFDEEEKFQRNEEAKRGMVGFREKWQEAAKVAGKLGVDIVVDQETNEPDVEATKNAARTAGKDVDSLLGPTLNAPQKAAQEDLANVGITPQQFQTRTTVKRGKVENDKFTNDYKKAEEGDSVEVDVGGAKIVMSYPAYERLNRVFPAAEQFDTEEQAVKAGKQKGDTITLFDKTTNKYRKAILE